MVGLFVEHDAKTSALLIQYWARVLVLLAVTYFSEHMLFVAGLSIESFCLLAPKNWVLLARMIVDST